jgi:hypothetical protein
MNLFLISDAVLNNPLSPVSSVGFEVLTAVSTKMAVFWVVASCSLVEVYQRFSALIMEAARSSETLLNFYQTTRRYNPEDSHLPVSSLMPPPSPTAVNTVSLNGRIFVCHFEPVTKMCGI